ncbi:DUF4149 domain-containing protein [Aquariibacter albus]|uniref:DUF4149 domain-containing protein n=1 Tax=Aquariibacter albus TaxID=2759899 RepID=A0A839HR32_9BURK|nr:DUF4149 domain-containing protein [Aquariibacter albus]MBB1161759.1 DUF4149 domain-containing protein [Aquariibacter albus]
MTPPLLPPLLERLRRSLPGVWLGLLLALGLIAAPTLFALLDRPLAGRVAGQLFAIEARLTLGFVVVLGLIERTRGQRRAEAGLGTRLSAELLLVLGVLFLTVAGYFALQPMMEAARAGQGRLSFGTLHGLSSAAYFLKMALLAVLSWRVAAPSRA